MTLASGAGAPGWGDAPPPTRERLTPADALARVLAAVAPLPGETIALGDAFGRVLASPVRSPVVLPPWDASAMDGYALRAADVDGATRETPVALAVDGTVAAGHDDPRRLPPGTARRIMTGAPVPAGADAVVRVEETDRGVTRVQVYRAPMVGRDIRRRGEDVHVGDLVLDVGVALGPAQIGLLAACAAATVRVHRQPRIAVLGSGDELVPLERADEAIAGQRIVGSNNVALSAAIREAGGIPLDLGIAADTVHAVRARLARAGGCDLVLTTAGISAGEFDCMRDAVAGMGPRAERWTVRMRPGAPMGFGLIDGGPSGSMPWLGLSGNPGAALVAFELFVRPAIRRLAGHAALFRLRLAVVLDEPIAVAAPVLHLLRVQVTAGAPGEPLRARLAGAQGASRLTTAARADALLVVPAGSTRYDVGDTLTAIPIGGGAHEERGPVG